MGKQAPIALCVTIVAGIAAYHYFRKKKTVKDNAEDQKSVELRLKVHKHAKRGISLFKEENYTEAIQVFTQAIELHEANNGVEKQLRIMLNNRSAAFEKLQDHVGVISDCCRVLQLDPRNTKAYERRSQAKLNTGDKYGALVDLFALEMCGSTAHRSKIEKIHQELATKETLDALQNKANCSRSLPANYTIRYYFELFHSSENQAPTIHDSLETLEKTIRSTNDPSQRGTLLYSRGLIYKRSEKYQLAAVDFQASIKWLQPSDSYYAQAQLEHGTFLHLKRQFDAAEKAYQLCLAKDPENLFALIRLAGLSFDREQKEAAFISLEKAFRAHPSSITALLHQGQLYTMTGEFTKALEALKQCVQRDPSFAMAYTQIGVTHLAMGQCHPAISACLQAIDLRANVLPEMLNYAGEAYFSLNEFAEASKYFDLAITQDPMYPIAYANKGLLKTISGQSKDLKDAIEWFRQAIQVSSGCLTAYLALARTLVQLGESTAAVQTLDAAFEFAYSQDELNQVCSLRLSSEAQSAASQQLRRD